MWRIFSPSFWSHWVTWENYDIINYRHKTQSLLYLLKFTVSPDYFLRTTETAIPFFYLDNARKNSDVPSCLFVGRQAVWFTSEQGLDGPVYGAADQWNGIGVFFDSFDNDGKVGVSKKVSCWDVIIPVKLQHFIPINDFKTPLTDFLMVK